MMLFEPKEHGSIGPGIDRLPVRSRLDLVIRNSKAITFIEKHFQNADVIANLTNLNDWRGSEVFELPSDDPNNPWITYEASQASLTAIRDKEYSSLSVSISFNYDMFGNHQMKIEGNEIIYEGPMPEDFSQKSEEIDQITSALTQAMMKPKEIRPDQET